MAAQQEDPMASALIVRHHVQMKYEIRVAMASDAGSSVAYLFDPDRPSATRAYLRIKPLKGKVLWCEGVINDENYMTNYNAGPHRRKIISGIPALVVGGWYRHLLEIQRDKTTAPLPKTDLGIRVYTRSSGFRWRWWASMQVSQQHPVSTNRIAVNLGLLGAVLGFIAVVLGIISLIAIFVHFRQSFEARIFRESRFRFIMLPCLFPPLFRNVPARPRDDRCAWQQRTAARLAARIFGDMGPLYNRQFHAGVTLDDGGHVSLSVPYWLGVRLTGAREPVATAMSGVTSTVNCQPGAPGRRSGCHREACCSAAGRRSPGHADRPPSMT